MRTILATILLALTVSAQTAAPTTYKLSVEATKEVISIEKEKQALVEQLRGAVNRQRLVMVGAGIPEAARDNCILDKDLLVCTVPTPSPTPK